MKIHPVRLSPSDDIRFAVVETLRSLDVTAAFVIQGVGSLSVAQLRFAGADTATEIRNDLEILTLSGSISLDGAHLHMSVSDPNGTVLGGHVAPGCTVRTTAELLLVLLPEYQFSREYDEKTGFAELVIRREPVVDAGLSGAVGSRIQSID